MDVDFFLKERTAFIKHYYEVALAPFVETMRKLDDEEPPYQPPELDPEMMSEEPPFLVEWLRAQTGFQVVGQTCVSMLSETLKIFFMSHEEINGLRTLGQTLTLAGICWPSTASGLTPATLYYRVRPS